MVFDNFFDLVFGWVIVINPVFGVAFVSFILTLIITLSYKYLTDQLLMKSLKDDIKILQKKLKELKDNPTKVMEVQKEAMEKNMKYMMHSLKPTIITFLPLILIFGWLSKKYQGVDMNLWFINSWLIVYILSSVIFSIILRKLFKV